MACPWKSYVAILILPAVAAGQGSIQVVPSETMTLRTGVREKIHYLSFSPDGGHLGAIAGKGNVVVWEMPNGGRKHVLKTDIVVLRPLVFSKDGKTISAIRYPGSTLYSWDVANGAQREPIKLEPLGANFLSSDGEIVATIPRWEEGRQGTRATFVIVRHRSGKDSVKLKHAASVSQAVISRDNNLLATATHEGVVSVWEYPSGALRWTANRRGRVDNLVFLPDSKALAMTGVDEPSERVALLWDAASGKVKDPRFLSLSSLVFSPDGALLAGPSSLPVAEVVVSEMRLYSVAKKEVVARLKMGTEKNAIYDPYAFSPDGKYLAAAVYNSQARESEIRIWLVPKLKVK